MWRNQCLRGDQNSLQKTDISGAGGQSQRRYMSSAEIGHSRRSTGASPKVYAKKATAGDSRLTLCREYLTKEPNWRKKGGDARSSE